jgi:multidrug efflux pump subunit AcrA (membrane-fusion protein)
MSQSPSQADGRQVDPRQADRRQVDPRQIIRRLNLIGFAAMAVLIGGVGGWAATTQLAGAVIAPGSVVVESNVKKVQHPTGGIVGEILVKEGDTVHEGQIVMRLDDTVTRATLGIVRSQLDELMSREARLLAERDGADALTFPEALISRRDEKTLATAFAGEQKLFESRRQARVGQRAQLRERIAQINEEIRGLSAQHDAKEKEIQFIGEELVGVTDLYKKNLIPIVRFMQLQRDQARLNGERGQLIADIARAKGKISETELQIIQLDQDFRTEVLKDLREAQGKIGRGPAQTGRPARAAIRDRVSARGPHRRRRDWQRRDYHADRAARRRARGRGQGGAERHRSAGPGGGGDGAHHGGQPAHHARGQRRADAHSGRRHARAREQPGLLSGPRHLAGGADPPSWRSQGGSWNAGGGIHPDP